MAKYHLKRLASPKTWNVERKGIKFITKPSPGPHNIEKGIPLSVLLKEVLGYAGTTREVKKIIHASEIRIDGKARKDFRFPVGVFDTLEFAGTNEFFRILLNKNGRIGIIKISKEDAGLKPCKIVGKTLVSGKLQLNLFDGKNIVVDKDGYKVGDTVLLSLPEQKIARHFKLEKKSSIFLTGGKHIGETGKVEDTSAKKIIYKNKDDELVETLKDYAFVVGSDKPSISLE